MTWPDSLNQLQWNCTRPRAQVGLQGHNHLHGDIDTFGPFQHTNVCPDSVNEGISVFA